MFEISYTGIRLEVLYSMGRKKRRNGSDYADGQADLGLDCSQRIKASFLMI